MKRLPDFHFNFRITGGTICFRARGVASALANTGNCVIFPWHDSVLVLDDVLLKQKVTKIAYYSSQRFVSIRALI